MAKRLFDLRNVPDDEADEVRALLTAHALDWYETSPGPWGISAAGLWLRDNDDYPRARHLLDEYQQQRREQAQAAGDQTSFQDLLRQRPWFVLSRLAAILALIVLTLVLPWLLLR
ncbi:DUF6164 family protein [Pseudoxanthomonas koreensis]|uniref:DUF6164 family protein n=1 Tax=Pseudoxanthomonas koreensis TaxID=266061 RepID=UPI0035A73BC6